MNPKIFLRLSYLAVIVGILSWVIAIPNSENSLGTLWMATWIVNPLGILFSIISAKKGIHWSWLSIILNILLTISVGPMWFLGDLFGF
ncbi:hypothetical protein ACFSO7_12370 [Bacillus sp. CGMCC 1.16607]|uniref:hypothetical protein n=1 Tax=Bacillus sp. CGMCC 1.16607 TaxID=3351842 RepID=UPI00362A0691